MKQTTPGLPASLPYLLIALALLIALVCSLPPSGPAFGASPSAPQMQQQPPDENAPETVPDQGEQLDRNKGVITPPPSHDKETIVPDPNAGTEKDVIPPPGTPGGKPSAEPR
jgi:hypothetical protein